MRRDVRECMLELIACYTTHKDAVNIIRERFEIPRAAAREFLYRAGLQFPDRIAMLVKYEND